MRCSRCKRHSNKCCCNTTITSNNPEVIKTYSVPVPGATGATGPAGLSAYEVAVANGFPGDEAQWLASLVGPEGPQGVQGEPGQDGSDGTDGTDGREVELQQASGFIQWRYVGDTTWNNLVPLSAITGPQGVQGEPGQDGTDGTDGQDAQWVNVTTLPPTPDPTILYLINENP